MTPGSDPITQLRKSQGDESDVDSVECTGDLICSINLPWYGSMTLPKYKITGLQIKDYWLHIFTKHSFEVFVFDLNRIAFGDGSTGFKIQSTMKESFRTSWIIRGAQEQFEEALVQYYLEHIEKDNRRELTLKEMYGSGSAATNASANDPASKQPRDYNKIWKQIDWNRILPED